MKPPSEPQTGWVYVVRWTTATGREYTAWRRRGAAARRLADALVADYLNVRVYRTLVEHWQEDWPPATSRTVRRRRAAVPAVPPGRSHF